MVQYAPPKQYIVVVDGLLSTRITGALPCVCSATLRSQTLLLCEDTAGNGIYDVLRVLSDLGVAVAAVQVVTEIR